nr:MAG: glycoprotein [Anopheles bunyavirus 1]
MIWQYHLHLSLVALLALSTVGNCCLYIDEEGHLIVNCTGNYAIRTIKDFRSTAMRVEACGRLDNASLCGPVEVIATDCKTVLLGRNCSTRDLIHGQVIVLWIVVGVIAMGLIVTSITIAGLLSSSKGHNVSTKLRVDHVLVRDDHGTRRLSYYKLFCLGLCIMRSPVSAITCISPHSADLSSNGSTYRFHLLPDTSACFLEGSILHVESDVVAETTLLYKTAAWKHHTWTLLACGEGNCGTKEQCSEWGDHGKVVDKEGSRSQYKKFCTTNLQPWTSCFYSWGCWLATNEISWSEEDEWDVKAIGDYSPSDEFIVSGLEDCYVSIVDPNLGSLRGDYLVTNSKTSMICKSASEEGYPMSGRIGDLQIVANETLFDYSAFSCDLRTAYSSGNCKVEQSGIELSRSRCLELPTTISMEHLNVLGSDLHVSPLNPREFLVRCPRNLTVHVSDHNCHSLEIEVHGLRSEQDFTFLTFKANSPNSNSSYVISSECHMEIVEVPCDGKEHVIRSYTYPVHNCFPEGSSFSDKTIEPKSPTWTWDHEDHYAFGQSGSYQSFLIYGLGALSILIILKIIFS